MNDTRPPSGARLVATAGLMGLVCLTFRLLTERGLSNDHYMHMAWAQQLLVGALPGRDFVDPGMPLAYGLSAAVQALVPGPFSETALSSAMLALAAAVTCVVVSRWTGSLGWGVVAALLETALQPRLYSYPKVLVASVTLLVLASYVEKPSRAKLTVLAAWSVAAGLLRYDLGGYVVIATGAALLAFEGPDWGAAARSLGAYAGRLLVVASPYLLFVHLMEGIPSHLRGAVEFARADQHQFTFELPPFPWGMLGPDPARWTIPGAATALAYFAYALVPAGVALAAWPTPPRRQTRALATGALALLICYLLVILRDPFTARVPDLAALIAILGGVTLAASLRWAREGRRAPALLTRASAGGAGVLVLAGAAAIVVSVWVLGDMRTRLRESRVWEGPGKMREQLATQVEAGRRWPWQRYWPAGPVPDAVRYIRSCTAPSDRLLVTWPAAEYYFFTGRAFAGGHAQLLAPRAFTGRGDQELMLERLEAHPVPVVLVNETGRPQLAGTYPLLEAYLRQRYTAVATFTIRGDSETIAVAVRNGARATSSYGPGRWPCGFLAQPSGDVS